MQLNSYGKSVTIINNKVKDLDEHHIDYNGKRAKIQARKNDKVTYARLTPKHVKKLFTKSKSERSLQENLEFLLKGNSRKRRKTKRRKYKKRRKKTRKKQICRYKIGKKKGKYKKC
jgi:hypothetical protein